MRLSMLAPPSPMHTPGGCRRVPVPLQVPQQGWVSGRQQEHGMLDPLEPPWVQRNPVSGRASRAGPAAWGGTWGEPEPPPRAAGVEQFDRAPSEQVKERGSTHLSTSFSTCSISHIGNSEHTMQLLNKIMLFLVLVCMWFLRLCLETNL